MVENTPEISNQNNEEQNKEVLEASVPQAQPLSSQSLSDDSVIVNNVSGQSTENSLEQRVDPDKLNNNGDISNPVQPINKKPAKSFIYSIFAGLIVSVLSFAIAYIGTWIFNYFGYKSPGAEEMGALVVFMMSGLLLIFLSYGSLLLFSLVFSKILIKKNKSSYSFWVTFLLILISSLVINFASNYLVNKLFVKQPASSQPVESWNKFDNGVYSFSYPNDTTLGQRNSATGELGGVYIEQTTKQYQEINDEPLHENQTSVNLFDVSVVNPEYYKKDPVEAGSSRAETYAKKILAMNPAGGSPSDPSFKGWAEGRVVLSDFFGEQAYGVEIVWYYKGPDGEYPIYQANGYLHGFYNYYYVDQGDQLYQFRMPVQQGNSQKVPSQEAYGSKILLTFKFLNKNDTVKKITQPLLSVEGKINYFGLGEELSYGGEEEIGDSNMPGGPMSSLIRLSNENPPKPKTDDGTGNLIDTIDYRIANDTKFIVDNKEISRSEIRKIDQQKSEFGGEVDVKYKRAVIKYYKFIQDDQGSSYYVAKSITFYEN